MWLALLLACGGETQPPTVNAPGPCELADAPATGPLESKAKGLSPVDLSELRIREARMTGDPGFYTLAAAAADCAMERDPGDLRAQRAKIHVEIQFHQFGPAGAAAVALAAKTDAWEDWLLAGDAAMEQGKLEDAKRDYENGLAKRPGLQLYDRMGFFAWSTGDLDGAVEYAKAAASAGTPQDPEPWAWTLTRLGWLHAITGQMAPEIGMALDVLPDYPPARFARGRIRLWAKQPGAAEDLQKAGRTVEAARALSEIDPTADVEALSAQDPRGYAIWISDREPEKALALLDTERKNREDALTMLAWAYAAHRAGRPEAADVARAAIATGTLEPRGLWEGGMVLGDRALLDRALQSGPGLLPSERAMAEAEKVRLGAE